MNLLIRTRHLLCLSTGMLALLPLSRAGAADAPRWSVPTAGGVSVAGLPAVTGHIAIDQFGYLPDERKIAVIADPESGYNARENYTPAPELELRRRDGTVAHRAPTLPYASGRKDAASGDRGWWFEFSNIREAGDYYVFDPVNDRRSHLFQIGPDVFRGVLRAAVRMYFYQREAFAHEAPFAEAPWIDGPSYLQDRHTRSLSAKSDASTERELSGGWMDAGDTNKYPTFLPEVIHPLLHAWQENPDAFTDDFGIPESGNGRPDLLDEIKWELEWLVKMQDTDGGVFLKMGHIDYAGATWPLSADKRPRYYGPKVSSSTLATAGVLAHAARVFAEFPAWREFATELGQRAERAWQWYRAHPRSYDADRGEIKSGDADKDAAGHDRLEAVAAFHLWALTGKPEYHDTFRQRFTALRQLSSPVWSPYEAGQGEALLDYTRQPAADPALVARIREQLRSSTHKPAFMPQDETSSLYRSWMVPTAYHWGSNIIRAGYGAVAAEALAYLPGEIDRPRLRQRSLDMLHALHGVNPLGLVYLTNMGREGAEVSATRLYHEWFAASSPLGSNPAPGYLTGGPNHSYSGTLDWLKHQPDEKCYADFNSGFPENSWEITECGIYYQAVYVRLLSNYARVSREAAPRK